MQRVSGLCVDKVFISVHPNSGDDMKNNLELLTSMVKTTRMGQTGIRAVLKTELEPELQAALRQQLRDYDELEKEAITLAYNRGWKLRDTDTPLRYMIEKMTWMKLGKKNRTSRVADMLIQGNTQGMISTLRDIHGYQGADTQIRDLCQKLLYCEIENIRQMKPFL